MGRKKKIRKLVEAVGHLFASAPDRKKLRKAQAFEGFLGELLEHRERLAAERDGFEAGSVRRVELDENLELLDGQIAKAQRLLEKLDDEDEEPPFPTDDAQ